MLKVKNRKQRSDGFSVVEAIVIIALITAISAVTLVNFSGLNQGAALNRAAREMALNFRKTQNMALAKAYVNFGGIFEVPKAAGLYFETCPPATDCIKYLLFGDRTTPPGLEDRYNAGEQIENDVVFERGVIISAIRVYSGLSLSNPAHVHVLFVAPEATVKITNNGGAVIGDRIEIDLSLGSGQIKTISVRNSGQISVR